MAPNINHRPFARTIDLTGLPEPIVEQVERIVEEARQQQGESADGPLGETKPTPTYVSDPNPTREEFMRILAEMASLGKGNTLPADFSRADIYDDHD